MASTTSVVVCAFGSKRSRCLHVDSDTVLSHTVRTRHQIYLVKGSGGAADCCASGVRQELGNSYFSKVNGGRQPGRQSVGLSFCDACTGLRLSQSNKRDRSAFRDRGRGRTSVCPRIRTICAVSTREEPPNEVYEGVYGKWTIEEADKTEVLLYRAGIVTSCASFSICSLAAFLPDQGGAIAPMLRSLLDPLYVSGAAGLGLSLFLIHVYVTEIKRFMQILWAVGCLGSLVLAVNYAAPSSEPLSLYVLHHPAGVWAVGPLFGALTALVFKEGLCYGKLEAAALVFVIPGLLIGHLAGLNQDVEKVLLGVWVTLYLIFAARKFTQPIKDDIGDKSIFMFNALPDDEKESIMARLQPQQDGQSDDF